MLIIPLQGISDPFNRIIWFLVPFSIIVFFLISGVSGPDDGGEERDRLGIVCPHASDGGDEVFYDGPEKGRVGTDQGRGGEGVEGVGAV